MQLADWRYGTMMVGMATEFFNPYLAYNLQNTKQVLKDAGYDEIITEDFYEPFEAAAVKEGQHKLLEQFQTEYLSDTIVCYLRLVTAAVLKLNSDMYEAFILDSYPTLEAFISSQVEPSRFSVLIPLPVKRSITNYLPLYIFQ
jgi:hypothetical protein